MSKRALRRHHYRRIKRRWERILGWWGWSGTPPANITMMDDEHAAARRATTGTPCSCDICGNPRRRRGEVPRKEIPHV